MCAGKETIRWGRQDGSRVHINVPSQIKMTGEKKKECLSVGALCHRPCCCCCCYHHPLGKWDTVHPFFLHSVSEALRGKNLTACFVLASGVLTSPRDCRHRRRETGHSDVGDGLLSAHSLSRFQRGTVFFSSEAATSQSASVKLCTIRVEGWLCLVYWSFESSGNKIMFNFLFVCFLKRWAK